MWDSVTVSPCGYIFRFINFFNLLFLGIAFLLKFNFLIHVCDSFSYACEDKGEPRFLELFTLFPPYSHLFLCKILICDLFYLQFFSLLFGILESLYICYSGQHHLAPPPFKLQLSVDSLLCALLTLVVTSFPFPQHLMSSVSFLKKFLKIGHYFEIVVASHAIVEHNTEKYLCTLYPVSPSDNIL